MTPQEKAIELANKYLQSDCAHPQSECCMSHELAIDCALICVDEIIAACEYNHVESYNTVWWQQVKQELEKL